MLEKITALSEKLRADGFVKGDRIAICTENCIEYDLLTLACWNIGVVMVPISTRYPDQKLMSALDSICCRHLFMSQSLKRVIPGCHCRILEDYVSCRQYETTSMTFEQFRFDLTAWASILFTSGSSGSPKGVLHTIGNHYYNALGALDNIPFERGDRWLMSLPMYHISGFSLIMRSLIGGGTLVFTRPNESIQDVLTVKKITHLSLVPTQLIRLMQCQSAVKALCQCKSILLGGASLNPTLIKQALDCGLPVSTTYGSTEAASQVTTSTPRVLAKKLTTCGNILPYRELKIADDGELLLKGQTLFQGYVLGHKVELPIDTQGYFHTGDMGDLDKENRLTVTGRKDRMVISGGENVYPEEIEKAILTIRSVEVVYVVPVPDAVMGQRLAAFVKTATQPSVLNTEAIASYLQTRLERFKVPVLFLPWPDTHPEYLKPDPSLFGQIALKALRAKTNS